MCITIYIFIVLRALIIIGDITNDGRDVHASAVELGYTGTLDEFKSYRISWDIVNMIIEFLFPAAFLLNW